jgi:hypothetical protein
MDYQVNKNLLHYEATGQKEHGDDVVLLNEAIDLTTKTIWQKEGFTIEKLFDEKTYKAFAERTRRLLISSWRKAAFNVPDNFSLERYHEVAFSNALHLTAIEFTKLIDVKYFPVDIHILEERISTICHQSLVVKNPYDNQSVFHFRVIRPQQNDNNPLHRDVWLEDYKDCINLYIPIAGSNENSSLIIVPGSHTWPESKVERTISGAVVNGIKYNVPAVTNIEGEAQFVRPDPKENEVLVFSPYLIHGGAANLNANATRISMEIRLWKK